MRESLCRVCVVGWVVAALVVCAGGASAGSLVSRAKSIRSPAMKAMAALQQEDGGYGDPESGVSRAGSTALVLYVFASSERAYRVHDGPFMSRAAAWLLEQQRPDGSFGDDPLHDTALAVRALAALDEPAWAGRIGRALTYLEQRSVLPFSALNPTVDGALAPADLSALAQTGPGILTAMARFADVGVDGTADARERLAWFERILAELETLGKKDGARLYFRDDTGRGRDPVVATAMAACVADAIRRMAKTLETDLENAKDEAPAPA